MSLAIHGLLWRHRKYEVRRDLISAVVSQKYNDTLLPGASLGLFSDKTWLIKRNKGKKT